MDTKTKNLSTIYKFLDQNFTFLFTKGFHIDEIILYEKSMNSESLILSKNELKIEATLERDQVCLCFNNINKKNRNDYSIDIIYQFFEKKICPVGGVVAEVNSESKIKSINNNVKFFVEFLKKNICEIEKIFSGDRLEETEKELKLLRRLRSKRMWG